MSQTAALGQVHPELTVLSVETPMIDLQAACESKRARPVDIEVVTGGRAAIQRLITASESPATHTRPDLVLLQCDLKLPAGMTILHAIKSSPRFETMPVVVVEPGSTGAEPTYETD